MTEPERSPADVVVHDVRNIVSALVNAAEILKRGQKLDADGRKAVDTIERQAERLLALAEALRRATPKA
jgi:signal transduction histidine kinase